MMFLIGGKALAQSERTPCGALLDELILLQSYPDSVISALSPENPCWESFSTSEQVRAYRLLAEEHLLQIPPDVDAAEEAWRNLLRLAPEYNLSQTQGSEELLRIARRFDHRPWRNQELIAGGHAPLVQDWGDQSAAQRLDGGRPIELSRTPLFSFEVGAGTWRNLNARFTQWPRMRRWEVGIRAMFRVSRYRYQELLSTSPQSQDFENFARLTFHETQQWVTASLGIRHHFDRRVYAYEPASRFAPYLHAGLEVGWLLSARFTQEVRQAEIYEFQDGDTTSNTLELVEIAGRQTGLNNRSANALRRQVSLWASAGVGMTYKWDTEYIALELGYSWGLTNLVNPNQRYANPEMAFQFGYVDADWNMHRLTATLSYWLPTYRTRLKPEFRP